MSTRYPGGIITKTPVVPAGPYENGTAPGIWTLDQQLQATKAGIWPTAGNIDPSQFIENIFSTYLYTGNGTTAQTITNGIDLSGKGGLVWTKRRQSSNNALIDTVRGGSNFLASNLTNASYTGSTYINPFTSTGYQISFADGDINASGGTYCSWTFREQPKFFDIVTYTGTGSNTTIAHNLGSVPGMIIVKRTDAVADWQCYHRSLANTQYLVLNTTAAVATGATRWNSTTPTSSVFSLGTDTTVNASAGTYVAYLFAHDAGGFGLTGTDNVISCGSFTTDAGGAGSATLGYEPQWVMHKRSDSTSTWQIMDNMRGMPVTANSSTTTGGRLYPNLSNADDGFPSVIANATGFTTVPGTINTSATYIYVAIRRGPMKVPTDATKVFTPDAGTNGTSGGIVTTGFPVDLSLTAYRSLGGVAIAVDRLRGFGNSNTADANPMLQTSLTSSEAAFAGSNPYFYSAWNTTITRGSNGANPGGAGIITWFFQRAPGFFDEVCYTGTGANTTQTHNLAAVPELIIVKPRNAVNDWSVYASSIGNGSAIFLNQDIASFANGTFWNSTTPTASVFSLGTQNRVNTSADLYVAYLFATVAGVSKVGSYTGNGTTQTINCGFGAGGVRFVLIKRTDAVGGWYVYDTARGMTVLTDPYLFLNSTAAEVATLGSVTTVSTGFALNSTILAAINVNAGTYIFLAIA